jgi:hypothetical protein
MKHVDPPSAAKGFLTNLGKLNQVVEDAIPISFISNDHIFYAYSSSPETDPIMKSYGGELSDVFRNKPPLMQAVGFVYLTIQSPHGVNDTDVTI